MNVPAPLPRPVDPEVARAETEATRVRAEAGKAIVATIFRAIVPLGIFGIALGTTAVVIERADAGKRERARKLLAAQVAAAPAEVPAETKVH